MICFFSTFEPENIIQMPLFLTESFKCCITFPLIVQYRVSSESTLTFFEWSFVWGKKNEWKKSVISSDTFFLQATHMYPFWSITVLVKLYLTKPFQFEKFLNYCAVITVSADYFWDEQWWFVLKYVTRRCGVGEVEEPYRTECFCAQLWSYTPGWLFRGNCLLKC